MAAAADSSGAMKYWRDGLPSQGVRLGTNDLGSMKFWIDGLPGATVFPPAGTTYTQSLSGTVSLSATLTKTVGKALSGTATLSGVLSQARVVLLALAGTVTLTGSLAKQVGQSLAGTLTLTGSSLVKLVGKALTGLLTMAGVLTGPPTEARRKVTIRGRADLPQTLRGEAPDTTIRGEY